MARRPTLRVEGVGERADRLAVRLLEQPSLRSLAWTISLRSRA